MKILAVNPGSTSTKIAVYEDETPRLVLNIRHSVEELSQFPRIIDQFEFRKHLVLEALEANDIPFKFDAIVGRGGLLKPIPGGVYAVNDAMLDDMLHAMRTHACNLGCLIAHELAAMLPGCPSFIADPGVVDELVVQTYRGRNTVTDYQHYLPALKRLTLPFKLGLVQHGQWQPHWQQAFRRQPNYRGEVVVLVNNTNKIK